MSSDLWHFSFVERISDSRIKILCNLLFYEQLVVPIMPSLVCIGSGRIFSFTSICGSRWFRALSKLVILKIDNY